MGEASSGGVGLISGATTREGAEGGGDDGGGGDSVVSPSPWEIVEFSAGNPRAEIISGKMHLYRDVNAPPKASSSSPSLPIALSAPAAPPAVGDLLPEGRNEMLCVLAVPSSLSIADFCQFAAALISKVVEMRMVKSVDAPAPSDPVRPSPSTGAEDGVGESGGGGCGGGGGGGGGGAAGGGGSTYSVILRFEDQDSADSFALNYHNRRFNSFEEGTCRVLFVRSIEITPAVGRGAGGGRGGGGGGRRETENAGSGGEEAATTADGVGASPVSVAAAAADAAVPPLPPPPSPPVPEGLTELPSCPVCLDRLDQDVSGVVTTICSHSFHASCLSKWGDSSCPVCRYTQQPKDEVRCHQCGSSENLWVCLICGYVGCGRYAHAHAVVGVSPGLFLLRRSHNSSIDCQSR